MWRPNPRLFASCSSPTHAFKKRARFLCQHRLPAASIMADTGDERRPDYSTWSNSSLITRITELERQLHSRTTQLVAPAQSPLSEPASVGVGESAALATNISADVTKKRAHSPEINFTRTPAPSRAAKQDARGINPSKYNTRYIALKFAYLGQRYNGLEHTNGNVTPLPTIEEVLWKALRRTRLIFPTTALEDDPDDNGPRALQPYSISWEGCDYSKAGRTDRGVSAFGQVIGIRVRSARPKPRPKHTLSAQNLDGETNLQHDDDTMQVEGGESVDPNWDDVADEINYIQILNKALPEDIRVLAWCPHPPPDFDARHSCRERRYRYFFTQPAFSPTPGTIGFANRMGNPNGPRAKYREGWLDIAAMREAAKHFEGYHDFRNFCKLDTSKQIENFKRIIYHSDIELVDPKTNPLAYVGLAGFQAQEGVVPEVSMESSDTQAPTTPRVYSFTLHGSAFLWHQVRHMVAVLFLVGQGLESPSIVADLLDVAKNPRKPNYMMASDAPLVLWDCIFPDKNSESREDALEWVYAGDPRVNKSQNAKGDTKFGAGSVVEKLWSVWRQRKMDEILAGALLDLTVSQGNQDLVQNMDSGWLNQGASKRQSRGAKIWLGGDEARVGGKYTSIMQKPKLETVEAQNAKWLTAQERKGAKGQRAATEGQEM